MNMTHKNEFAIPVASPFGSTGERRAMMKQHAVVCR